jgi:hypothetical protein
MPYYLTAGLSLLFSLHLLAWGELDMLMRRQQIINFIMIVHDAGAAGPPGFRRREEVEIMSRAAPNCPEEGVAS